MIINAINLTNVKVFGEMEFWFAIIKVIAVIAMILFGAWLLFSDTAGPQATVRNLWEQGGFLPHGWTGLVMMMAIIMFSFGGLELVGITAAEADNPEQSIPKATNQVIYRILIFISARWRFCFRCCHGLASPPIPAHLSLSSMSWAIRLSPMR